MGMTEKLKILHISALPVWSMDGKGGMPSLRETLNGHSAAGHEIELILPQFDPFSDDVKHMFVPEGNQFVLHFAACRWLPHLKRLRLRARRFGGKNEVPYVFRWVLNLAMLCGLAFSLGWKGLIVRKNGFVPHMVYAHNQYAALPGYLLGRLWRVPNVTRLYGTFLADLMTRPLVSLRYPTAAAGYLVPSSLLICANDGTRGDEVARKFNVLDQRFRFWQNGVEPPSQPPQVTRADLVARFGPTLRMESKWAVSCSRLSYWKRIDRMVKALSVCRDQGVDCQLVIAGDGPEKSSLTKLAQKEGVSGHIVWLGAVAHDDIWALMNNADVFMLTNDVTNRCNPLYEAAWAGLPVVSVHDPSTADLLRHRVNALLSDKDDAISLGQNLAELCRDDEQSKQLGAAQKKLSNTFWTWEERMREEVMELERLVDSSNAFERST
jgi:glycosyltransferase involved in cell wall biosynthesis